jgi:hypothetical protein
MGPAVNAMSEVVNNVLWTHLLIGVGACVVVIALSFATDRVSIAVRRWRARVATGDLCCAFAEAVARGDLEAAEAFAAVALSHGLAARGLEGEMVETQREMGQ